MRSLRLHLFAILAATGAVWRAAAAWTYVDSQARFERILDRRLMEAARMQVAMAAPTGSVRGSHRSAVGSGLSLTIVDTAPDRSGAVLRLGARSSGSGLRTDLVFAAIAFRKTAPVHRRSGQA